MKLNIATLVVILVAAVGFAIYALNVPWTPWHIAGVAIVAPSLLLLVTARLQLGRAFSVEAKASELVTTGLYSKIRNPIYVFGSCVIAGLILIVGRPIYLLIFVAIIPLQIWRTRKESSVLESAFGDEYRKYRASTWF